MGANNRIIMNPVPDIHTHEFTLFALNDLEEKYVRQYRRINSMGRGNTFRFVFTMCAIYYIYEKLNKKIEEQNQTE